MGEGFSGREGEAVSEPTEQPVKCRHCALAKRREFDWIECRLGIRGPSRSGFWKAGSPHACEKFALRSEAKAGDAAAGR